MILAEHLHNVDRHWAVLAVGEAERDRGLKVANARLVKRAVGQQMLIDFPEDGADDDLLHSLAMAYEMAAIEGLDAFLNPTYDDEELRKQCSAGDAQMEVLLRWLQAASRQMVAGSLWWVARAVNSRVARFVSDATKQALFELLPPPMGGSTGARPFGPGR